MDDKIKDADVFYTEFALEEELARKMSWKLDITESDVNTYIYYLSEE